MMYTESAYNGTGYQTLICLHTTMVTYIIFSIQKNITYDVYFRRL